MPVKSFDCAFLRVICYKDKKSVGAMRAVKRRLSLREPTDIQWTKTRKKSQKKLMDKFSYINSNAYGEREMFLEYFCQENYSRLAREEAKKHRLHKCKECLSMHWEYYSLLRSAKSVSSIRDKLTAVVPIATVPLQPAHDRISDQNLHQTLYITQTLQPTTTEEQKQ